MKKIFLITMLIVVSLAFSLSGQRGRYAGWIISHTAAYGIDMDTATIAIAEIRGQNGETISNVGDGEWNLGGANLLETTDIVFAHKTIIKTISIDDDASIDDFQFDDDAVNANEQTVDFGAIIPAYAEIVSCQVRCIEAVVSSEADPDDITGLDVGVSDGGGEILATGTPDDLNDVLSTVAGASPEVIATNAARNLWVNVNPADNWSTMSAGRWAVMLTYIDYGAVYTAEGP